MSTATKTRKLIGTAMLAAVSVVLMFLSFPVPLMPSFIKMDLAELPALISTDHVRDFRAVRQRALVDGDSVVLTRETADALKVKPGETVRVKT